MFQEEKIYIGIDVSKAVLDIFILPTRKYMQFKNTETDIQKLIKKIALFSNVLVVLESTGGYEKPLTYALSETKADVCVMNPRQIRGGRAAVRKALYMPTLVAIKYNLQIRTFYQRLCNAGKSKMTALIACMRKLLITMNALIKKNQYWSEGT